MGGEVGFYTSVLVCPPKLTILMSPDQRDQTSQEAGLTA